MVDTLLHASYFMAVATLWVVPKIQKYFGRPLDTKKAIFWSVRGFWSANNYQGLISAFSSSDLTLYAMIVGDEHEYDDDGNGGGDDDDDHLLATAVLVGVALILDAR